MTFNTKGEVKGEVASSGKASSAADPPLSELDALQLLLDLGGMVPGAGAIADLLNAAISAARGDWLGMALSIFSAAPAVGDAAALAKIANNGPKYAKALAVVESKVLPKLPDRIAKPLKEFIGKAKAKLDDLTDGNKAASKPEPPKKEPETGGGGKDSQVKTQKPHKNCGKLSKYKDAPSGRKEAGLEADHIPSGKAWEKAMLSKLEKMGILEDFTPKQLSSMAEILKRQAPTITVPEDVHADGNTWRAKNTAQRSSADARDLKAAAARDAEAIQKSMDGKDHGCSEAYRAAAKELIENTDFDAIIDNAIKDGIKRFNP